MTSLQPVQPIRQALPIGSVIHMATATVTPVTPVPTTAPKAPTKAQQNAAAIASGGKVQDKAVAAFVKASTAAQSQTKSIESWEEKRRTSRVLMVRQLVILNTFPKLRSTVGKSAGTLNKAMVSELVGIPATSLTPHFRALKTFLAFPVNTLEGDPTTAELDAVMDAWSDLSAAAKKARADKAKAAKELASKSTGTTEGGAEGGDTEGSNTSSNTNVSSAIEDAVAKAESLDRMVTTFAKTWAEDQINDLMVLVQSTLDKLEDLHAN